MAVCLPEQAVARWFLLRLGLAVDIDQLILNFHGSSKPKLVIVKLGKIILYKWVYLYNDNFYTLVISYYAVMRISVT